MMKLKPKYYFKGKVTTPFVLPKQTILNGNDITLIDF